MPNRMLLVTADAAASASSGDRSGGTSGGETIEDGLRREVFEETGAEIRIARLNDVYKNMKRDIVALVFCCRPTAPCSPPATKPHRSQGTSFN